MRLWPSKQWEVVDQRGKVESDQPYYLKKNAETFADCMNEYSEQYFQGRKFSVRRIGEEA